VSDAVKQLADLLSASSRVVAFTGAGISTESGIPDFRSPGGLWTQMQPIMFDDFVNSEEQRRETWRRKIVMDREFRQAEPNRGHRALAALAAQGQLRSIITQNVDGLHQLSGVAEEAVIELHGNTTYARCLSCAKRYELEPIIAAFERDGSLPVCAVCGGLVKTATISFGQSMPVDAMQRAEQETLGADLFIVLGSSLVVYPAAGFPRLAKRNGARLVIINREATDQDDSADLVIHDDIGPTIGAAVGID